MKNGGFRMISITSFIELAAIKVSSLFEKGRKCLSEINNLCMRFFVLVYYELINVWAFFVATLTPRMENKYIGWHLGIIRAQIKGPP